MVSNNAIGWKQLSTVNIYDINPFMVNVLI